MNIREKILVAGLSLLERDGPAGVTREAVAETAGVTPSLVSYHAGTMPEFRDELMKTAVERGLAKAVAWGLVAQHPAAVTAPIDLRRRALETLAGV